MDKQRIIIDGNKFSDLGGFFDEVEDKLTAGRDGTFGRNMNAFNDVLRGGFGHHDYEEPLELLWINSGKSRTDLDLFEDIVAIIKGHDHIDLVLA